MRIAIIGGADYDEQAFEDFLYGLHRKYPDATIITGTAMGRNEYENIPGQFDKNGNQKRRTARTILSAERAAHALLTGLGHTVITPSRPDTPFFSGLPVSNSDLELAMILNGDFDTHQRADVIVTAGKKDSSRCTFAWKHWERMDSWRDPENRRPIHHVAPVKTKPKPKKRRATKKRETLAA